MVSVSLRFASKQNKIRSENGTAYTRGSFHFQKISGTLKINILLENKQKPSLYTKNNRKK